MKLTLMLGYPRKKCMSIRCRDYPGTWVAHAGFDASHLSAEAQVAYSQLWIALSSGIQYPNSMTYAASNNTYDYGRGLNIHITALIHLFRMTGDIALLDYIYTRTEVMRGQLADSSIIVIEVPPAAPAADGYLNWQNNYDAGFEGTDLQRLDEELTHAFVAEMAYLFFANRSVDPKYDEAWTFWVDYLRNHFEAKWRARGGAADNWPTFPISLLNRNLTHVFCQFVKYPYYLAKILAATGDPSDAEDALVYQAEADRMADIVTTHLQEVSTPLGTAWVWDHAIQALGAAVYGPQEVNYARYTVQAAMSFNMEGYRGFAASGFMEKMARTFAHYVVDATSPASYAGKIDGTETRTTASTYSLCPLHCLAAWDTTGELYTDSTALHQAIEGADWETNPRQVFVLAGQSFAKVTASPIAL